MDLVPPPRELLLLAHEWVWGETALASAIDEVATEDEWVLRLSRELPSGEASVLETNQDPKTRFLTLRRTGEDRAKEVRVSLNLDDDRYWTAVRKKELSEGVKRKIVVNRSSDGKIPGNIVALESKKPPWGEFAVARRFGRSKMAELFFARSMPVQGSLPEFPPLARCQIMAGLVSESEVAWAAEGGGEHLLRLMFDTADVRGPVPEANMMIPANSFRGLPRRLRMQDLLVVMQRGLLEAGEEFFLILRSRGAVALEWGIEHLRGTGPLLLPLTAGVIFGAATFCAA